MNTVAKWKQMPGNMKALEAAIERAGGHSCPFCKGKAWTIGDKLIAALELPPAPGNPARAFVHLTCRGCCYVALLDAQAMGIRLA